MAVYIILGTLAAIGLLSVLWVSFGWLLPGGSGGALVCIEWPGDGLAARYCWLRDVGLMRVPMLIVTKNPQICEKAQSLGYGIEICSPETLFARLEREREYCDGTGNGDSSGRHQRRGISEL